jgi:hypothetical protein
MTHRLDAADKAVRLGPSNADAHYARASLLSDAGDQDNAMTEYEQAVALRPDDYVLWLELGRARDQVNDAEGALGAFREATRLAPYYAGPHWQFANTLFRAGRRDEAFAEFRSAVVSDPKLLPQGISLAWAAFGGDAGAVEQALQPRTPSAHLALASFFARQGKASDAIAQFRAAGGLSNEERRLVMTDLLASKNFSEAFEVWSSARQANGERKPPEVATLINGGFEEPINLNDIGFGWVISNLKAVRLSLDTTEPHSGAYSLRLDWGGDSDPSSAIISQLVLVEPKRRYRLSFAGRTQDLLTVGLPIISVTDAGSEREVVLGQSNALPRGTSGWQDYSIEFEATDSTRAVRIGIQRQNCSTSPCAAFGHAWLDDFSLRRL